MSRCATREAFEIIDRTEMRVNDIERTFVYFGVYLVLNDVNETFLVGYPDLQRALRYVCKIPLVLVILSLF